MQGDVEKKINFTLQLMIHLAVQSRGPLEGTIDSALNPAVTKTSQRRHKNVLFLVSKTSYIGLKWKSRQLFFKTSSRLLLGDVLKTYSRRRPRVLFQETSPRPLPGDILKTSKTSSRHFLRKVKDHLETIYGFSLHH